MTDWDKRLRDAILVRRIGTDHFESRIDDQWVPLFNKGIFGGTFLAQSIAAASETVPSEYHLHYISSQFLRPGTPDRVQYRVNRLRDGSSYIFRTVEATQGGRVLFLASISFQSEEEGQPDFYIIPPVTTTADIAWKASHPGVNGATITTAVLPPEESMPASDRFKEAMQDPKIGKRRESLMHWTKDQRDVFPLETRHAVPDMCTKWGTLTPNIRTAFWLRSRVPFDGDHNEQRAALAYQVDHMTLSNILATQNGVPPTMMATLNHTMWFFAPFNMHDWLLLVLENQVLGNGRGLVTGRIYRRDGVFVAAIAQEGVVRMPAAKV
ncbi:palmitoyl-CoA hydrolase [Malassezia cuniculi]|uniref:Palmitoyl-CoA hydrolase n=1 Tax=Malassezia cuniculi TaxID=948313 RepID=A0AAF0EVS0_9BASI|nr:palmitoyl-CoA hydrolase [Malassezia cuniculi]